MTSSNASEAAFEQRFARVEQLLADLSQCADPRAEWATREVVTTVLELHRRGLARMLAVYDEQTRREIARDPQIGAMLLLHGLHPLSLEGRVTHAVEGLRERFRSKLADVTVDVRDGRITLSLVPVAGSCGSTRSALEHEFEIAMLAVAPDADSVSVRMLEPAPALVTLRLHRSSREHENGSPR